MSNGTSAPVPTHAPSPCNQYTSGNWSTVIRDMVLVILLVLQSKTTNQSDWTRERTETIENRQEAVIRKQEEAAAAARESARRADEAKRMLEQKTEYDEQASGVSLYSTWKHLENVAENSGSASDHAKAAEAKRLYDAHVRRMSAKSHGP